MKTYEQYKDSGVEWIGEIPVGWDTTKLKYETSFVNGYGFQSSEWKLEGIPIIRIQNLNGSLDYNYYEEQFELNQKYSVFEDDLLFSWSGNIGTSFGPYLWSSHGRYYLNQHIFRLDVFDVDKSWFYYVLKYVTRVIEETKTSGIIGLVHVTKDELGDTSIPLPPLPIQQQIVTYLDQKTSQIDELIDKKTRKIELLQEYRTSLINQVVTKGLDPNVEMKDSGVEWIGEIPVGWERGKMKHLTYIKRGSSPRPIDDPKYFDDFGQYSWVRISDVSRSERYLTYTDQKLSELGSQLSHRLGKDELVMSISGSVGKVIITKIECCIHDGFVTFENPQIDKLFLYYLLTNEELYKRYGKLGTQLNINSDIVGNMFIPLPPLPEQHQIVTYLDQKTQEIDTSIQTEEKKIEHLKEYRQSLISNVVTGKIDVRDSVSSN